MALVMVGCAELPARGLWGSLPQPGAAAGAGDRRIGQEGVSPTRSPRRQQRGLSLLQTMELLRLCLCRYFRIKSSVG